MVELKPEINVAFFANLLAEPLHSGSGCACQFSQLHDANIKNFV
jgi:hypothetical protein